MLGAEAAASGAMFPRPFPQGFRLPDPGSEIQPAPPYGDGEIPMFRAGLIHPYGPVFFPAQGRREIITGSSERNPLLTVTCTVTVTE